MKFPLFTMENILNVLPISKNIRYNFCFKAKIVEVILG